MTPTLLLRATFCSEFLTAYFLLNQRFFSIFSGFRKKLNVIKKTLPLRLLMKKPCNLGTREQHDNFFLPTWLDKQTTNLTV